ncbi:six-cysteine ranthipeptide SCIFF [Ammonifex thiophilus]|uniref:Six-cysteine peptide SCIFF n=1 Tax=Ammonifex thiophilus TaxID=444093 RepID=A0A3D8P7T4_9THEO|nr:six-cysteine ranthipeptide SCIFF [Ammonifex thiophilus]RDV84561.1 six-cysteine peptide SCIFF [Ammonifex thiophilus]
MKRHIKTLVAGSKPRLGGCGECQASCQSACKTSCTVGNQSCKQVK